MCGKFARRTVLLTLALGLLVALAMALGGCGSAEPSTSTPPDSSAGAPSSSMETSVTNSSGSSGETQELTVSAASSLTAAFTEIAAAFDKANNSKTTLNFDSSGALQKQIEAGAPVDVFASASSTQVNNLLKENLVDQDSVMTFARNEILLAVPANSTLGLTSFQDLTKPEVKKIAYGDPASVPHGTYAEEMLTTLGLLDQVKPKVIYTKNVSQTLTYIKTGEVDAGIMFATDAVAGGNAVKVVATSEPAWHSPITYPIAIVTDSRNKSLAQKFIHFVMSAEGQSLLQKQGFVAP